MFVPAWQVFTFNFVKRPIISALWYAVLVHFILEPFSTTAILISSALFAVSFFSIRFFLAIVSPVPMIASLVLCFLNYQHIFIIFVVAAVVWLIIYFCALIVTVRSAKGIYFIDPATGVMYRK